MTRSDPRENTRDHAPVCVRRAEGAVVRAEGMLRISRDVAPFRQVDDGDRDNPSQRAMNMITRMISFGRVFL